MNYDIFNVQQSWDMLKFVKPYYLEPHRVYHNWDHITRMLDTGIRLFDINEVQRCAILFHDIIYDPESPNNEEISVDVFRRWCDSMSKKYGDEWKVNEIFIETVSSIIMDTERHFYPTNFWSAEVLDLDLETMGGAYEIFSENGDKIRKEYSHVSDNDFAKGRKAFFEHMLAQPHIYNTYYGRRVWEPFARNNITCYLIDNS